MIRYRLLFAHDVVAALAALTKRQQAILFRAFEALLQFPHVGETLAGKGRHDPTYARTVGKWRIVWWIDEPVNEVQILAIFRTG